MSKIIKEDDFISRNINLRTVNEIQDIQCLLRRRNNPNENELLREFTQDKNIRAHSNTVNHITFDNKGKFLGSCSSVSFIFFFG